MRVIILMATYNGSVYLSRQIDSIINQTIKDWELWVRDDGSSDNTLEIIRRYVKTDSRIRLIVDDQQGGGAAGNFGLLMQHALSETISDHFAFVDQDDVWHTQKLSRYLIKFEEHNSEFGRSLPCMLYGDLEVVDKDLKIINSSFWKMEKVDPAIDLSLIALLSRNVVPGCSMMFNRSLLEQAVPISPKVIMHDWWLLLLAVIFGRVIQVRVTSMKYVQHGGNQLGAKDRAFRKLFLKIIKNPLMHINKIRNLHSLVVAQTYALLDLELPKPCRDQIVNFLRIRNAGIATRLLNVNCFASSSLVVMLANTLID